MPMAQLLTNVQSAQFVDTRLLAQLTSDSNTDATIDSGNTVLTNAILRAGEEVASASTKSNSYTVSELEALATANNAMLQGLVADLALCFLFERRGADVPESIKVKANRAYQTLADIADGKRVFAVDSNRSAGSSTVSVVSTSVRGSLRMVADSPFFPTRLGVTY